MFSFFSEAVRAIQSLLSELNSDLSSTEMTLSRVEDSLLKLTSDIDDTSTKLEQVKLSQNFVRSGLLLTLIYAQLNLWAELQHSHLNYEY